MSNWLLTNANVYTVNPRQPRADSIAIANNRIVAVGRASELDGIRLPELQRVDMKGAFVLPGLIDAHLHLQHTGFAATDVSLDGVDSLAESLRRVSERVAITPKGEWIKGWGWLQSLWDPPVFPTRQQLDAISPDHPIALHAKSGHALWANSLALTLAGVDRDTPDTSGGQIERDAIGDPTGIFLETAEELVMRAIPKKTHAQQDKAVADVMRAMNKAGLTSVHCMDGDGGINSFKTYQRVLESGQATLRIVKMLPVQDLDGLVDSGLRSGFGGPWLRIGNVKIFTDGALGPRTAWMAAGYEGEPANHGLPIYDPELLVEFTRKAHGAGLGVVVHAIGDRANHEMLNAIEISRRETLNGRFRDRIEHAQVLLPGDVSRFAQLNVIASMQPIHCTSDMHMVDANWGASRAPNAYAWRTLWDSGARLAFGSDAPVETFDPLTGIYAAVTRRRANGSHAPSGWQTQEAVTIDETLYAYTLGAAYAGYNDHELGSIEPGKLADLTVLSQDLTAIPAEQILSTTVLRVMVDGEWRD
jgi:hypothetical protein